MAQAEARRGGTAGRRREEGRRGAPAVPPRDGGDAGRDGADGGLPEQIRSVADLILPRDLRPPRVAFLATVGAMAVFGVVDWPVVAIVAARHVLAAASRRPAAGEVGEGLERA